MDIIELKEKPIFWSRLGFCDDPTIPDEQGRPSDWDRDFTAFEKYHRDFEKIGVNIHSSILHSGWVGNDTYDYTMTDRTLDSFFSACQDSYYLPRVKFNVPLDWCRKYPEHVFLYENGPRDPEEIASLVGTLKQDLLGYESANGRYANEDGRPNLNGVISLQSISSPQWRHDAGVALEKLMEHIENGKYADRVVGYHICFGPSGENLHWGRESARYGDYGIEALRQFYDYGMEKYGSREVLAEKWMQPEITRDTVCLPSAYARYSNTNTLKDLFRGKPEDVIIIDYEEFLSRNVADAIEYFGKIVKDRDAEKLVGTFYGYHVYVRNSNYAGHLAMDQMLNSPYVDFLAAPFQYHMRRAGEPSGEMSAVQSVNRKKIWVDETDCRTHLEPNKTGVLAGAENLEQTNAALWREACKNISHDSGFWWMDLGGGWYDSPEIMQLVENIYQVSQKVRKVPHKSISDVLMVVDENSLYRMGVNQEAFSGFQMSFGTRTRMTGALVDIYRMADLQEIDLQQYKLIVFALDVCVPENFLETLKFAEDTTLMFNYAFGIWGETFDLQNVTKHTGFELEEYSSEKLPMLRTTDKQLVASKIVNGRMHIINLKPRMPENEQREILRQAGVRLYAPEGFTVYGDNRIFGVFSNVDYAGEIELPEKARYVEVNTGKIYEGTHIQVQMNGKSALVFVKEELL